MVAVAVVVVLLLVVVIIIKPGYHDCEGYTSQALPPTKLRCNLCNY